MKKFVTLERTENFLFFSLAVIIYCSGGYSIPFFPDESHWIATSSAFEAYFGGDFDSSLWDESYWTVTQPPLPRYLIGFGRWTGGSGTDDLNLPWDWYKDEQTNIKEGRMPSSQLLRWARLPMRILTAITIFIVFVLLKKFLGRIPAYLWFVICLVSQYLPVTLGRAMGEAPLLACICILLFISCRLLQVSDDDHAAKTGRIYFYILFLGVVIGLAESSKLNGLSILASVFMLVLLIGLRMKNNRTLKIRFVLFSIFILAFSSQFTFVLLNPYLWKDPLNRTEIMFEHRVLEMRLQQNEYPDFKIQGFSEHISVISKRIFQTYSSIHFEGAIWINMIFFFAGLVFLIRQAVQYFRHIHTNPFAAAVLTIGTMASTPSLFTPLDWDRYFLLPVFFSTLGIAIGIWRTSLFLYRFVEKRQVTGRMVHHKFQGGE